MGNAELGVRVIVKDDVNGTSKKAMMAYFKKQSMEILHVTKKPSQMLSQCERFNLQRAVRKVLISALKPVLHSKCIVYNYITGSFRGEK